MSPRASAPRRAVPAYRRSSGMLARAGAAVITILLMVAGPAAAHPFIRGGEVPVDSLVTMTLAMTHGCASETAGEGEATTDASLEVPDWLRVVDVPAESPWTVERETGADGTLEVITWRTDAPVEPAPAFDLEVVISGEPGEDRFLRVFQACDDFVYRWIGTPDEPADDPAVRVTLAAADPDAPPPPEAEPEPAPGTPPESEADLPDTEPEASESDDAEDASATDDTEVDAEEAADADALDGDSSEASEDDGGLPGWLLPMVLAVLLAVGAGLFFRRGL